MSTKLPERKDPTKVIKAFLAEAQKTQKEQDSPYWRGKVYAFQKVLDWFESNPDNLKPVIKYKIDIKMLITAFIFGQIFQMILIVILQSI